MNVNRQISRRTLLRGAGVAIGLPWLESIMPRLAQAAEGGQPRRMAFFSVPNGMHMPDWTPAKEGHLDLLPPILAPLAPIKSSVMVLSGLTLNGGRPQDDGPGDHARSAASFLTGAHPYKTSGKDIHNGVSVDQVAAAKIGHVTRFASLELGCEVGAQAGNCDSGYSCAYSSNISWRAPASPMAKEVNPRAVFDRLFGAAKGTLEDHGRQADRDRRRKSVLDFALEDAADLRRKLDAGDGRKLDEYLYAVREVERRLQKGDAGASLSAARPSGTPRDFAERVRLMMDMIVLAFQIDSTRIVTFMYPNEGSNRSYPEIGVSAGHHEVSHHGGDPEKQAQISKINRFHLGLLAEFLKKLDAIKEGGNSLLQSAMIVYGSGLSDGNRHNHDELPILLAGRGGGSISAGRHVRYPKETPLTNLYLTMLDRVGVVMPRFSDSRGKLEF
jgi:hypothetical protein